jgi:DNA-directed RNA polymerase subunit RPC12/RpoP
MSTEKKNCPDCKSKMVTISLDDLMEGPRKLERRVEVTQLQNLFAHLALYVCPDCGRAVVYSQPKLKELAKEAKDAIIGTS